MFSGVKHMMPTCAPSNSLKMSTLHPAPFAMSSEDIHGCNWCIVSLSHVFIASASLRLRIRTNLQYEHFHEIFSIPLPFLFISNQWSGVDPSRDGPSIVAMRIMWRVLTSIAWVDGGRSPPSTA